MEIIKHDGQSIVYDRIYLQPKKIDAAVNTAFSGGLKPLATDEFERVKLRWMKPDKNGQLVPR